MTGVLQKLYSTFQESFWQWLGASVVMGDEQLNRLAGPDAVQYLRYREYGNRDISIAIGLRILFS